MKATLNPKVMCTQFASARRGSKHMLTFWGIFSSPNMALWIALRKANLWNMWSFLFCYLGKKSQACDLGICFPYNVCSRDFFNLISIEPIRVEMCTKMHSLLHVKFLVQTCWQWHLKFQNTKFYKTLLNISRFLKCRKREDAKVSWRY